MIKTVIVTETGSDIPPDIAAEKGIKIVPMYVQAEGKSRRDGSFPVNELFESYSRTKILPKTSAANMTDYRQAFRDIGRENPGCNILHLGYSAITTASFNNARLAAQEHTGNKVIQIDTKQVSGGLGAIVLQTAEFLKQNPRRDRDTLHEYCGDLVNRSRFAFFPGQLEYLKAGGRVSNAAYLMATVLGLKPLIEMQDGKLTGTKKYRGNDEKVYKKLINDYLSRTKLEKSSFFMVYSHGLDNRLKKELEKEAEKFGYENIRWVSTGCVISTHAGPGAFGLGGFEVK